MAELFTSSRRAKNRVVELHAVAVKVLHLSGKKKRAKGREIRAEFFVERASYNVADVKYTSFRKTPLFDSFLQMRIKAS